ncbi:hypothetical protein KOR42_50920 [Thalassoglobus neptunius]|uniref:Uncharacterized protein n=1 Tax=Thalassoglobus neptunius TaxID=1938619 RepID=A0A5C5VMJ7_9PLAN|nr:hypothetical protein [Thalassoglobus neptunius]TWT39886.1 hypothetical protein KOR42_50920 [Thalassoglobus neptunius]
MRQCIDWQARVVANFACRHVLPGRSGERLNRIQNTLSADFLMLVAGEGIAIG